MAVLFGIVSGESNPRALGNIPVACCNPRWPAPQRRSIHLLSGPGNDIILPVINMDIENKDWTTLSYEEKNHQLYLRQKALLDSFLERGAISQAQHDKSLHDLTEKMGENQ